MLPDAFKSVLSTAAGCAASLGHSTVSVSHVAYVLSNCGAMKLLYDRTGDGQAEYENLLVSALASYRETVEDESESFFNMRVSRALARCIERAGSHANGRGQASFSFDDIVIEALQETHGTEIDDLARTLFAKTRIGRHRAGALPAAQVGQQVEVRATEQKPVEIAEAVSRWTVDLVQLAREGRIDEAFGRDEEIGRLAKSLSRRRKNNAVLVGEPGVGKTAVVEGLALRIARGDAPPALSEKIILSLDTARLVGGTTYRGDLEERVRTLVEALQADPRLILFIDEIHVLSGGPSGALAGVADILKPALASGRIRCIGATTFDENARYFSKDMAMARRFQVIPVLEPSRDASVDILLRASSSYAAFHGVSYNPEAVAAAVDLSISFVVDRQLPDKALDILDEAGARASACGLAEVGRSLVVEIVRDMVNDQSIENFDELFWLRIEASILARVAGQDHAVSACVSQLRSSACRPAARGGAKAFLLFSGPAKSGKRHLARTLAATAGAPVLELDMGSYSESSRQSELFGAPPGYVGYDSGGRLTEFVRRNPTSVVYLNNLAAAHEAVREKIMEAISTGVVADAQGRPASFRNVIVVSSVDEDTTGSPSIGFLSRSSGHGAGRAGRVAKDHEADATVSFAPFGKDAGRKLVEMMLRDCVADYAAAGVRVEVGEGVAAAIASEGGAEGGAAGYRNAFRHLVEGVLLSAGRGRLVRLETAGPEVLAVDVREAA